MRNSNLRQVGETFDAAASASEFYAKLGFKTVAKYWIDDIDLGHSLHFLSYSGISSKQIQGEIPIPDIDRLLEELAMISNFPVIR